MMRIDPNEPCAECGGTGSDEPGFECPACDGDGLLREEVEPVSYQWRDAHEINEATPSGVQLSRPVGLVQVTRFAHAPDMRQVSRYWTPHGVSLCFHVDGGDEVADRLAAVLNERGEATVRALLAEAGIE